MAILGHARGTHDGYGTLPTPGCWKQLILFTSKNNVIPMGYKAFWG